MRTWCADNNVELVYMPTDASRLNWTEADSLPRATALNGTGHRNHDEPGQAIARYVRWRNAQARPTGRRFMLSH
ncbi:transposase [Micromonospora sp. NPDC050187]|uniref:transposase n=1 Tax=Micromonospora sp. NPDC050187 TaxID=3364277 RepID=UPI003793D21A